MICEKCGYEMIEGLILCPQCLAPTKNFKEVPMPKLKKARRRKHRDSSNKKNDEINQWFDMGLF